MSKPLINAADAETHSEKHGAHFEYSMTELSHALGAKAIGANLTRVPPGKAAFPFHHHAANEEHFFVISGSGILSDCRAHPRPMRRGCAAAYCSRSIASSSILRRKYSALFNE